jgi:hypothetical protein
MSRPTSAVPRRTGLTDSGTGLDDAEESAWMFAAIPRQPRSFAEQLAAKAGVFDKAGKYTRRYVRVCLRGGTASAFLHETDDPDESPQCVYDLMAIGNVLKLSVPCEEALSFVSIGDDDEPVLESIHGQLAVGLDLGPEIGMLRLAVATTDDRDAWFRWFSELVVQRELNAIEVAALEERRNIFDDNSRSVKGNTLAHSSEGKQVLREYTRRFLQNKVRSSRADEVPGKGKLLIQPNDFKDFVMCGISGVLRQGTLHFSQRGRSFFAPKVSETLELTDQCRIVAPMPWSSDFVVYLNDFEAWQFRAKSVEQRNAFVQYFRLVKGRGVVTQTEQETYPYLTSAELAAAEAEESSRTAAKSSLSQHGSFIIVPRHDEESSESGDSEVEAVDSPDAIRIKAATQVDETAGLTFDRALEEFPHLLWTTLDDLDSPRSTDSDRPRSVRGFKPFAGHFDHVVLSYIDDSCQPHLFGRRHFRLAVHPQSALARTISARNESMALAGGRAKQQSPRSGSTSPRRRASAKPVAIHSPRAAGVTPHVQSRTSILAPRHAATTPRRRVSPLSGSQAVSAVAASRSLRLGLRRLDVAHDDKERLRPRAARQPVSSGVLKDRHARTPPPSGGGGLRDSDLVRVPKCLFSNVAPHIALSAQITPSHRR